MDDYNDEPTTEKVDSKPETDEESGKTKRKPRLLKDVDEECFKRYESDSKACDKLVKKFQADWKSDVLFANVPGNQWNTAAKAARTNESNPRPVIEWNQVTSSNNQIINPVRGNPPGAHVIPTFADAGDNTLATANMLEGMLRAIERNGATPAFIHSFSSAVNGGVGAYYLTAEYESDNSFDYVVKVKKILDMFSVRWDTSALEPDGSDMMYAMIDEPMTKESFESAFPGIPSTWYEDLKSGNNDPITCAWGTEDNPLVTNYIYVTTTSEKLYKLKGVDEQGRTKTAWASEEPDPESIAKDEDGKPIFRYAGKRKVTWKKLGAGYELESFTWPGQNIPVYIVPGKDILVDGERTLMSATRPLKSPQEVVNYGISAATERSGLTPRGHWVAADGSLNGQQEQLFSTSHLHNRVLIYNSKSPDIAVQDQLPAPKYEAPSNMDQGIMSLIQLGTEGIKSISGIYNPSLGKTEQELSGVAIKYLDQNANTSNADYLSHALNVYARTMNDILEIIPHYYSTERQLSIVGKDGMASTVWINKSFVPKDAKDKKPVHYDLTKNQYKCLVEIGKKYETQLQENSDWISTQAKSNPIVAQTLPDIIFKIGGEAAGADASILREGVERIKKALPPQLTQEDKGPDQVPPQAQQLMQQAGQHITELSQALQQAQAQVAQLSSERELKERELAIKEFDAITKRIQAEGSIGLQGEKALMEAEASKASLENDLERTHIQAATRHSSDLMQAAQAQNAPQPQVQEPSSEEAPTAAPEAGPEA